MKDTIIASHTTEFLILLAEKKQLDTLNYLFISYYGKSHCVVDTVSQLG